MWTYNYSSPFELCHHGIKGQRWGVRNGPPYPLGSGKAHPAKEKAVGKAAAVGGVEEAVLSIVSLAAPIAITAAATYADKQLQKKSFRKYCDYLLKNVEKTDIMSLADLPQIKGAHSISDDLSAVNPNYRKGEAYQRNCSYCTTAYELRRRGRDVEALPRPIEMLREDLPNCYIDAKWNQFRMGDKVSKVTALAESWGEGARGTVGIHFKQYGHVISLEVRNGKAIFIDPQTGLAIKNRKLKFPHLYPLQDDDLANASMLEIFRTDNLDLSPDILKTVKKRRSNP